MCPFPAFPCLSWPISQLYDVWKRSSSDVKSVSFFSLPVYVRGCKCVFLNSLRTAEWVMSRTRMSHVTHTNESCPLYGWVMSHIQVSHVTCTNESCHTYRWVISHTQMSHVTWTKESWFGGKAKQRLLGNQSSPTSPLTSSFPAVSDFSRLFLFNHIIFLVSHLHALSVACSHSCSHSFRAPPPRLLSLYQESCSPSSSLCHSILVSSRVRAHSLACNVFCCPYFLSLSFFFLFSDSLSSACLARVPNVSSLTHTLSASHRTDWTMQHAATHSTLQHIVTRCNTPRCNTLQHAATRYIVLRRPAAHHKTQSLTRAFGFAARSTTHYSTLQYTATHCNTRQRIATHCNPLQHTATRWNTESLFRALCYARVLPRSFACLALCSAG